VVKRLGRTGALVAGLALAGTWIAGAVVSGHLSPGARGPLLDGTVPIQPYRWVDPPPELAASNRQPFGEEVQLPLGPEGSEAVVLTTPDGQLNVFFDAGTFASARGQSAVRAEAEPFAPSTISTPPGGLSVLGNVYRLQFSYEPSGEPIPRPARPFQVLLTYPVALNAPTTGHNMAWTKDGSTWVTELRGSNLPGTQQAFARIEGPGYVAILGIASALPTPADEGGLGGALKVVVLVVAGASVLIAVGLYFRGGRRDAELLAAYDGEEDEEDDEPD
jgi:hypothetical protein